jgi:hypothetical protein
VFYFVQEGADSLDLSGTSGSDDASSDEPAVRKTQAPRATRLGPPPLRPPEIQPYPAYTDPGANLEHMQAQRDACAGLDTKDFSPLSILRADGESEDKCHLGHCGKTAAVEKTKEARLSTNADTVSQHHRQLTHLHLADAMAWLSPGCRTNRLINTHFEALTYNEAVLRVQRCDYSRGYQVAEVPLIGSKTVFWHELFVGADTGIAWLHSESPRSYFSKVCDLKSVTSLKEYSHNYAQLGIQIKGSKLHVDLIFADPTDKAMFLEIVSPFIRSSRPAGDSQMNLPANSLRRMSQ